MEKLPPLIISKAARPHTLKKKGVTLSKFKVDCYHNSSGWITLVIFVHWLVNGMREWPRNVFTPCHTWVPLKLDFLGA